MSEADQTATSTDAREASKARVTTLADLVNTAADAPPKAETAKAEPESKEETESKPKKNAVQERISELVNKRKAAKAEADAAKREAQELRARLEAIQAQADPLKQGERPNRSAFASDEDYVEALADWKATQAIAKREAEQAEARVKAEMAEVTRRWEKRVSAATSEIEDFADVVGSAETQVADHISQAIVRSEQGPYLLYFLASHQDEARKLNRMHPIDAIRYLADLERELAPASEPKKAEKTVETSKAPPPLNPVRQAAPLDPGPASSYAEYKARRKAERRG